MEEVVGSNPTRSTNLHLTNRFERHRAQRGDGCECIGMLAQPRLQQSAPGHRVYRAILIATLAGIELQERLNAVRMETEFKKPT
jgi:hypothetical protein